MSSKTTVIENPSPELLKFCMKLRTDKELKKLKLMKLNKEELEELLLIVKHQRIDQPWLRFGQSFWNNLITNYPVFESFKTTAYDCFYNDRRITNLIGQICDDEAIEHWKSLNMEFQELDAFKFDPTYINSWAKNHGYL